MESRGKIPVQETMRCPQPAATRALQTGQRMKQTTAIERVLVRSEKEEQRQRCDQARHSKPNQKISLRRIHNLHAKCPILYKTWRGNEQKIKSAEPGYFTRSVEGLINTGL